MKSGKAPGEASPKVAVADANCAKRVTCFIENQKTWRIVLNS